MGESVRGWEREWPTSYISYPTKVAEELRRRAMGRTAKARPTPLEILADPDRAVPFCADSIKRHAWEELKALRADRARLATATELVKEAYPHIVALDDARNDGLSGRLAAFLEGCK